MSKAFVTMAAAVLAGTLLGGCAAWKEPAAPPGAAEKVGIYNTTQMTPDRYKIIQHIWVDDWHSNIKVPTFRTPDEGVDALKRRAAAVGGTGLVNVMCLDARGYEGGRVLCYGDAIKMN
jgi:hypothetical protein